MLQRSDILTSDPSEISLQNFICSLHLQIGPDGYGIFDGDDKNYIRRKKILISDISDLTVVIKYL